MSSHLRPHDAVAFTISELPGERAEALLIAMAALVPTAGERQFYLWIPVVCHRP